MFKLNNKQYGHNFCQKYQQTVEFLMYLIISLYSDIGFIIIKLVTHHFFLSYHHLTWQHLIEDSSQTNNLPTVDLFSNTGMDILKGKSPDNYDEIRGRNHLCSLHSFRNNSMISIISSKPYHQRMEENNSMDIDDINNTPSELSYEASQKREICLRAAVENYEDMLPS